MKKNNSSFLKSEFNRNVFTLLTGTTIAQAIPIAISPILTRIYSPENFGVYALFIAITSIFGSIANGRYELAIMLPDEDKDAINIVAFSLSLTILFSCGLLVIILIFHDVVIDLFENRSLSIWLYLVPLGVFLISTFNILNYFNTRLKKYINIARANIFRSILVAIVQVIVGFIQQGVSGLISGSLISNFFGNFKLSIIVRQNKELITSISFLKMRELGAKYINFLKFSVWAILANTLSQNLTGILISSFYNISTLGFYSLVQRVLGFPSTLIGNAIGQVFFQEASKEKQKTGKAIKTFNSTFKKLLIIGLPIFLILFFIIKDLFIFVFGEEWRIAGVYAQILIPYFFIRFIVSSFTLIPIIYEKNGVDLIFQVLLTIVVTTIIAVAKIYNLPFTSFLLYFSATSFGYYSCYLIVVRKMARFGL